MQYAFLDDSQIRSGGLYVYAHAFVVPEEIPVSLVFSGGKEILWEKQDQIGDFLLEMMPEGYGLIACNHYMKYERIWEQIVTSSIQEQNDRYLKKQFRIADLAARQAAKNRLEQILGQAS